MRNERKPLLYFLFLLICLLFISRQSVYASTPSIEIDKKVKLQNKILEENMNNSTLPGNGEKFNNVLEQYDENSNRTTGEWKGKEIKSTFQRGLVQAAISFRKYVIPMYVLFQLIITVLLSTVGSKSLQKRRLYIIYSVSFTVLFMFILNIPVIAIYFQNRSVEEVIGEGGFYNALYGAINFLRINSPVISILLIIYGTTNIVLSKRDLPRRLQGRYLIKFSFILLIVMQTLPFIIKLII